MNRIVTRIFMALAYIMCTNTSFAQDTETEILQQRIQAQVAQLNDYLSLIADPTKSRESRKYYVDAAKRMFIANCNEYENDGITHEGIMMEITSVKRKGTRRILMRTYLNGLMNGVYPKMEIISVEVAIPQMSSLKKIGDNEYVCTYDIEIYPTSTNSLSVCTIRYKKKVTLTLQLEQIEGGEIILPILFGDILAVEQVSH